MALKGLIIDADGILLEARLIQARAWQEAIRKCGFHLSEDRILPELGQASDALIRALLGKAAESTHGEILQEAHARICRRLQEDDCIPLRPGALALLEAVRTRELGIAIVSSFDNSVSEILKLLKRPAIDSGLHDFCTTSLRMAVDRLGFSPAQCALLCDTPYLAQAGRFEGLTSIALTTKAHSPEVMRRAGVRASYPSIEALLNNLDGAIRKTSPGSWSLTSERLTTLMAAALEQAREGMSQGEVPVGCVVAHGDGRIISQAYSKTHRSGDVTAHAEILALGEATRNGASNLHHMLLATTLEPCVMCYGAAMQARVDTIIYALEAEGNGGLSCCSPMRGPDMVAPRMVRGILREESRYLLTRWLEEQGDSRFLRSIV